MWRSFSKYGEVFQNVEKFIKVFEKILKGFGMGIKTDEPQSLDSITI